MQLLTYLHDPDNLYLPIIKTTKFSATVNNSIIAISPTTTQDIRDVISKLPFEVIEGGLYGTARINLIKHAIKKTDGNNFFVCDFDKLLHWLKTNPEEFEDIFNRVITADLTVIGRSTRALATYPDTWVQTENIATSILAKITKKRLDFMNGPIILSSAAAKLIANSAKEQGVGSCAEFCLMINQANLTIENLEVDGLTWEDPDRYKQLIDRAASYDDWKYDTYNSLYEWRKRVDFLNTQVEVMIRMSEEPINPKYPVVHNRTLEN